MLTKALHVICLEIFPCTLVEEIPQVAKFVRNNAGHGPHGVSQTDRWSLCRSPEDCQSASGYICVMRQARDAGKTNRFIAAR